MAKKQIRSRYQNKLVFLSSEPLRGVEGYHLIHEGLSYKEDLRSLLMDMLTEQGKNIAVQFDVCKREVLDDIFNINKGCKLLVLDSNFSL